MRTARTGDTLATAPVAAGCAGTNGTAVQFIPRSRGTNKPSSAAAYQTSRPKAISFTRARNGKLSFVVVVAAELVGALVPRAGAFFPATGLRHFRVVVFSIIWFPA